MTIPLLPRSVPRDLLEGGPLVATPSPRAGRSTAQVDLNRTQATRVAKAMMLLVERSGGSCDETARLHGFGPRTVYGLINMAPPWRVCRDVLERLEIALGLQPGDVLAGRAPEPKGAVRRRCR